MVYWFWEQVTEKVFKVQEKAIRIMSCSEYLVHSEPLFKSLGLLTIEDLFCLKLLKFYYNLTYNLLPTYFNCYLEILNRELPHSYHLQLGAHPVIRIPRTRLIFAESSVLYQLVKLINFTLLMNPELIRKIREKKP